MCMEMILKLSPIGVFCSQYVGNRWKARRRDHRIFVWCVSSICLLCQYGYCLWQSKQWVDRSIFDSFKRNVRSNHRSHFPVHHLWNLPINLECVENWIRSWDRIFCIQLGATINMDRQPFNGAFVQFAKHLFFMINLALIWIFWSFNGNFSIHRNSRVPDWNGHAGILWYWQSVGTSSRCCVGCVDRIFDMGRILLSCEMRCSIYCFYLEKRPWN